MAMLLLNGFQNNGMLWENNEFKRLGWERDPCIHWRKVDEARNESKGGIVSTVRGKHLRTEIINFV